MGLYYRGKRRFFFRTWRSIYSFIKWYLFRPKEWRHRTLKNRMNKLYTKKDLTKDYIPWAEASEMLKERNFKPFCSLETMEVRQMIFPLVTGTVPQGKGGAGSKSYMNVQDIKDELLRREMCAWKDYALYRKELYSRAKHRELRRSYKGNPTMFYLNKKYEPAVREKVMLHIGEKNYLLGTYNVKTLEKMDKIIQTILANKKYFLLESTDPDYIDPHDLHLLGRKITKANVETFDPIPFMMNLRRSVRHPSKT